MDGVLGVLLGFVVGALIVFWIYQHRERATRETLARDIAAAWQARSEAERARIVRIYEARLRELEDRHRAELGQVRQDTVDRSRAVLKGKMAEQVAPLLPGFAYWPADARFLGDPVDYVVFNGYSACRDGGGDADELEVVILDIKQGKSTLSRAQRQIAEAVAQGRVRFEVVRIFGDGTVRTRRWQSRRTGEAAEDAADVGEG